MSIAIMVYYTDQQTDPNLLYIIYGIFNVNGKVFFPIVVTIYFAPVIINEFKQNTVKILFSSVKYREEIIIGKFLGAIGVFSIVFIGLMAICIVVLSLVTDTKSIFVEFYTISYGEALSRIISISLLVLLFMICLGSYIFMIGTITKSQGSTIFILLLTIFLYTMPIFPEWIIQNFFMVGFFIYDLFAIYEVQWLDIFRYGILFLVYTLTFTGIGAYLFSKKQI